MNWIEALFLGLLQGFTEYLPVSSSGHLTIAQDLLSLDTSASENLLFDTVVHTATVLSTLIILWPEVAGLLKGTFTTTKWNNEKDYVSKILIAIIPILIVGLFFKDYVENIFAAGTRLVSIMLLITAVLLLFAQYAKPRIRETISPLHALIIGISQSIAVLPGLSRSGTTIATGLLLGNKKEAVAQFSFLIVIPPILGEALLNVIDIIKDPSTIANIGILPLTVAFVAALVSGCIACKFMLNIVKNSKLVYFAIYCAVVGIAAFIYSFVL